LHIVADGQARVERHPPAANVHRPLIDEFVEAVEGNREPAVGGDTGRHIAAIEDEIYGVSSPVH
jgi:hypothetical protein